ncbi:hypothetical protein pipiens_001498 [Culex pipiens pipiens]|uniref:Uncharacterized protein n=1 Tax=Culex pipiens pipiens TaxID=38569 RepID=A0ABD1CNN8_CULPP
MIFWNVSRRYANARTRYDPTATKAWGVPLDLEGTLDQTPAARRCWHAYARRCFAQRTVNAPDDRWCQQGEPNDPGAERRPSTSQDDRLV